VTVEDAFKGFGDALKGMGNSMGSKKDKDDKDGKAPTPFGTGVRASGLGSRTPPSYIKPGTFLESGGSVGIDPLQVPAATLSQVEVDSIRDLLTEASEGGHPMSIVHDSVTVELPRPKPKVEVTTQRTFDALMKRPRLAWEVLQLLKDENFASPWSKGKGRRDNEGATRRQDNGGTVVALIWIPAGGGAFLAEMGQFPPLDCQTLDQAKAHADAQLQSLGYILVD